MGLSQVSVDDEALVTPEASTGASRGRTTGEETPLRLAPIAQRSGPGAGLVRVSKALR
jgi:hypothetical protein